MNIHLVKELLLEIILPANTYCSEHKLDMAIPCFNFRPRQQTHDQITTASA